jgi:hypothetical protein
VKTRIQTAESDSASSAFERFNRLARRLFAVPKREVDEKLAEYKRHKKVRRVQK